MGNMRTGYAGYIRLMIAVSEAREKLFAHLERGSESDDGLARCAGAIEALDRVLDHGAKQGQVRRQFAVTHSCRE